VVYWIAAPLLALWFQSSRDFGYMLPSGPADTLATMVNRQGQETAKLSLALLGLAVVGLFFAIRFAIAYVLGRPSTDAPPSGP
jgi:hypothetical protein